MDIHITTLNIVWKFKEIKERELMCKKHYSQLFMFHLTITVIHGQSPYRIRN